MHMGLPYIELNKDLFSHFNVLHSILTNIIFSRQLKLDVILKKTKEYAAINLVRTIYDIIERQHIFNPLVGLFHLQGIR